MQDSIDEFFRKPSGERFRAGIVGTFDVENYGDLLFPLMAEAAFERRGQPVQVLPFSPNRRTEPSWPFRVYSTLDLPAALPELSALLIGGGQILRFDTGYPVPVDPEVNVPVDYWLIPAILGTLSGTPVVWNAIGAWTGSPPAPWYNDVLSRVLPASHFVGVRDIVSRQHLAKAAPSADIQILPDTAFSLSRFWPLAEESKEHRKWRRSMGVDGRYAVIQADHRIATHAAAIQSSLNAAGQPDAVILPICWCHGDRAEEFPPLGNKTVRNTSWLSPRLISEIIGRSELVIASSLHACIAALSYGVPVLRVPSFNATDRKFELLNEFEGIAMIDAPEACAALLRRSHTIEPRVVKCADRLDRYWYQVLQWILKPDPHPRQDSMLAWAAKVFAGMKGNNA